MKKLYVSANFDIWILGDAFVAEAFNEYRNMTYVTANDKKSTDQQFYMQQYFNVRPIFNPSNEEPMALTRIINSLIAAVNEKNARLSMFIIAVLDKDILIDISKESSLVVAQVMTMEII